MARKAPQQPVLGEGYSPEQCSDADRARTTDGDREPFGPQATQPASDSVARDLGEVASHDLPERVARQLRDPSRYAILGEHGRGGLGKVSRALDRDLGRDVAIKELISRTPTSEARFLREALITARLEHPGIVPIHEAGRWPDGTPFYAMKLVAGRPLRDLIAERPTVRARLTLLHHVIAVADALAYAHGRNIIHRDLKPANVIVGDFGETIVIDWGLAKDLSDHDDAATADSSFRIAASGDLTAAGSVLGTPAYMSPEQERGERVDQRTDVFAIGAMLWELCSLHKVPPESRRLRHRLLREAGVDADLATIVDRCLEPSSHRRYPDAGALASDLKAFKAGARIEARSYSFFAVLLHWVRRHRAIAFAIAGSLVTLISATLFYIHSITSERARTGDALQAVQAAKAELSNEHAELVLKHAESLLVTDPTAATDILARYQGPETTRVGQLRAEAEAIGVAVLRATPHSELVRIAIGRADRSIFSTSIDGTIRRTTADGRSQILGNNASSSGRYAYSTARGLLVYACDPSDLCLWDVNADAPFPAAPVLHDLQLTGIALSPRGTSLAMLLRSGALRIVDLTNPASPVLRRQIDDSAALAMLMVDDDTMVTKVPAGIEVVERDGRRHPIALPESSLWDNSLGSSQVAIATERGEGVVLDVGGHKIVERAQLCHRTVSGFRYLRRQHAMAYACREGTVGLWSLGTNEISLLGHLEGHVDILAIDGRSEYVLAGGGNGLFEVFDLVTGLKTSYKGHGTRLTWLAGPTDRYPFFLSGDLRGGLRVWPVPPRTAHTIANAETRIVSAFFHPDERRIVATTFLPQIAVMSRSEPMQRVGPHLGPLTYSIVAPDRTSFATYGASDTFELWSMTDLRKVSSVATGQGLVSDLKFWPETKQAVTAGRDGRVLTWNDAGQSNVVMILPRAAEKLAVLAATNTIVASSSDGSLWRPALAGKATRVVEPTARIVQLVPLPDQRRVCLGLADGTVTIVDTSSWATSVILHGTDSPRDIVFSSDGELIAIAANNDRVLIGVTPQPGRFETATWSSFPSRARKVVFARDRLLVLAGNDGMVSTYDLEHRTWTSLAVGTTDFSAMSATRDGKTAAVFDRDGRAIWIDLASSTDKLQLKLNKENIK